MIYNNIGYQIVAGGCEMVSVNEGKTFILFANLASIQQPTSGLPVLVLVLVFIFGGIPLQELEACRLYLFVRIIDY